MGTLPPDADPRRISGLSRLETIEGDIAFTASLPEEARIRFVRQLTDFDGKITVVG